MSAPLSRRAALAGALAAIPTLGGATLSAGPSLASPANPDAELFALQGAIAAADKQLVAALDVSAVADSAFIRGLPPRPVYPEGFVRDEAWQKRVDEIVARFQARGPSPEEANHDAAMERWEAECERLRDECGETAASEAEEAAHDEIIDLRNEIIQIQATTLTGLVFKAKYAAAHYSDDYDPDVMVSIVDDLLALGKVVA